MDTLWFLQVASFLVCLTMVVVYFINPPVKSGWIRENFGYLPAEDESYHRIMAVSWIVMTTFALLSYFDIRF